MTNRLIQPYIFPNSAEHHKAVFDIVTDEETRTHHLRLVYMPPQHLIHALLRLAPGLFKEYLDRGYRVIVYITQHSLSQVFDLKERRNIFEEMELSLDILEDLDGVHQPFLDDFPTEFDHMKNGSALLEINDMEDPVDIIDKLNSLSEKELRFIATHFALENAKKVTNKKLKRI